MIMSKKPNDWENQSQTTRESVHRMVDVCLDSDFADFRLHVGLGKDRRKEVYAEGGPSKKFIIPAATDNE
jgi:hypothetical protein